MGRGGEVFFFLKGMVFDVCLFVLVLVFGICFWFVVQFLIHDLKALFKKIFFGVVSYWKRARNSNFCFFFGA